MHFLISFSYRVHIVLLVIGLLFIKGAFSSVTANPDCIFMGATPSFIVTLKNQRSVLLEHHLSALDLNLASVDGIQLTHARPMADGAYILFARPPQLNADGRQKTLKRVKPGCYSTQSVQAFIELMQQKNPEIDDMFPNRMIKLSQQQQALITRRQQIAQNIQQRQWNLLRPPGGIAADKAWHFLTTGHPNAIIAVLDDGILNNDSLNPNILPGVYFNNIGEFGLGAEPSCGPECIGGNDHGTHVAGIVAASGEMAYGEQVYGVAPTARVLPVNVFTKYTTPENCGETPTPCLKTSVADLVNALHWLNNAMFPGLPAPPASLAGLNMSLAGPGVCVNPLQNAFDALFANSVVAVVAAGNDDRDARIVFPANCRRVITVAATGPSGERAFYSNWGRAVTLAAPGGNSDNPAPPDLKLIYSTVEDGYDVKQGTSMAAPHVAGVVALMRSLNPQLDAVSLQAILTSPDALTPFPTQSEVPFATISCLDPKHPEKTCGAGILNAYKALQVAIKPRLIAADRNPLDPTIAYITYQFPGIKGQYTLLGAPDGASITIDTNQRRFVIANLNTPKSLSVAIKVDNGQFIVQSNPITIPNIL